MNPFKIAPTFLEKDGKRKRFETQDEVDTALEGGWHGWGELWPEPTEEKNDMEPKKRGRPPKEVD